MMSMWLLLYGMGNVNDVAPPRLVVDHEPGVSSSADRFLNPSFLPQR